MIQHLSRALARHDASVARSAVRAPLRFTPLAHSFLHPARALALIVALAALLQLALLGGHRFHPDEALYATWARWIATGQDVWLAQRVVDKPPLFLYLLAALFGTLGASEEIARLPNMLASLGTLVLTFALARRLYGDARMALLAAAVLALSPLALLFAPTAFVDPVMLYLLLLAAWFGVRGQFAASGFAFALSLAAKQDTLLLVPIVLALLCADVRATRARLRAFLLGGAAPLALVGLWSALRPQPDFLSASLAHYGGLTFVAPDMYGARVMSLLALTQTISSPWLLLGAVCLLPLLLARARQRADLWLLLLGTYWLLAHLVLSFPTWDRYLLPLAPLAAMLIARIVLWLYAQPQNHAAQLGMRAVFCLLLLWPLPAVLRGDVRVGRDSLAHEGVEQVGAYFWRVDTSAALVYVHALSWELDYYSFGRALDRRWMPDADALAADAQQMPLAQRYVLLAADESLHQALPHALAAHNLKLERVFAATQRDGRESLALYLITTQPMRGTGSAAPLPTLPCTVA